MSYAIGMKLPLSDDLILRQKNPMFDTDVYCYEVCFIFCRVYACFVLFPIGVTVVKCIIDILFLFICMQSTF